MPITKHNFLVTKAEDIPRVIAQAFHIASTGRPGPVLVDIAKDALQARTTFSWPPVMDLPGYRPVTKPHAKQIREAAKLITSARRPVLYVGGGVIKAGATAELKVLAELTGAPVTTTLMALGAFPDSHPLHVGMPGMHGAVTAVTALQKADLIVALGARFDDRVTGKLDSFAPYAKIVHADIDPAEIGKNRAATCRSSETPARSSPTSSRPSRRSTARATRATTPPGGRTSAAGATPTRSATTSRRTAPCPRSRSSSGSGSSPRGTIFAAGVGQHQMWAAHFVQYEQPPPG